MDDFFVRAMLGGIGVALAAGPLGCIVIWRRMAYFGAALAHSALLGLALGFVLGIDLRLGVLAVCLLLAVCLALLEKQRLLASDTVLGIVAHGALALGLVALALVESLRVDLLGYLFGDVLAIGKTDVYLIFVLAAGSIAVLVRIWRSLLAITVNPELAAVEGIAVERVRIVFVLMLAVVIAIGMKVVGILLIISLLIIPAAAARRLSSTPEQMAFAAALVGVASVVLGLLGSLHWDLPAGPAIVLMATVLFAAGMAVPARWTGRGSEQRLRSLAAMGEDRS